MVGSEWARGEERVVEHGMIFRRFWKVKVPHKVLAFSWRALKDRLPTRQNLVKRQVIHDLGEAICPLCGEVLESLDHLFALCRKVVVVWAKVF